MSEVKQPLPIATVPKDALLNKIKRVFTSATLFLVTFFIVHITFILVTALLCKMLGYKPIPTYNGIDRLPTEYKNWSTPRVFLIFMGGMLWVFLLGVSLLRVYNKQKGKEIEKLFVLWLILNCIVYFLYLIIISPLGVDNNPSGFFRGPAVVATWLRISPIIMAFFSILAVAGCVFYGYYTGYEFLKFSYSNRLIQKSSGKNHITMQYFISPVILGSIPIMAFANRITILAYLTYTVCLLAVGAGMIIKNINDITTVKCVKSDVLNRLPWLYLAILAGFIVLIKLLLIRNK
jgi:hypothetical protein